MSAAITYRIGSSHPASHIFEVALVVANPEPQGQELWLPNWIPGSYMIRDFSRNIVEINAFNAHGEQVNLKKLDKSRWQAATVTGPLTVKYRVYAWDLSVRAAHLDQTHGYFNGTSVFLAAKGHENAPHIVHIERPNGVDGEWEVATSLPMLAAKEWGFGSYQAADYDELIDHPVEMGTFDRLRFEACGVPHDIVVTGKHRADLNLLARDLEKVCTAQIQFFGEPAPFDRYVFQIMAVGNGYGGLEHRASTSLLCSRDDLPLSTEVSGTPSENYRTFLGLCSHEYFHSWNVKRIKPEVFIPYDLRTETHTGLLWAFEGITSYYDDLMLVRSGLISTQAYLDLLSQQITRHLRARGRLVQSVTDSSFDAWTKYYKQDENAPNAVVSYYVKGALVALCLDLELRRRSMHRVSLDDVMRQLWNDFGSQGKGVADDDIEKIATSLVGEDLSDFFFNALHTTNELPLAELLTEHGVAWHLRAAESATDMGGKLGEQRVRTWLGVKAAAGDGGALLAQVFNDGPAMAAGLSASDTVVAVDGLKVNAGNLEKYIAKLAVGQEVVIHAFRRDELMTFTVKLGAAPADTCSLVSATDADANQRAERWILGK